MFPLQPVPLHSCKNTISHSQREHISCEFFFFFFGEHQIWLQSFQQHADSSVFGWTCRAGLCCCPPEKPTGGNKKKINPHDARAINKLFTMPCGERLQTLQTVPKFTPQKDDVTTFCHDSTTQLNSRRNLNVPHLNSFHLYLKVDTNVRMLSDEITQFRLTAASNAALLMAPCNLVVGDSEPVIAQSGLSETGNSFMRLWLQLFIVGHIRMVIRLMMYLMMYRSGTNIWSQQTFAIKTITRV